MSLEDAIRENTTVLKALIEALGTNTVKKPIAAKVEKAAEEAPTAPMVDPKTVSDKLLELVKLKGRDTAINLLKSFGAAKFCDVNASFHGELLEKINKSME